MPEKGNSIDSLFSLFPNMSSEQKEAFITLGKEFKEINASINLVSRKDIDFLYERHFLHALSFLFFWEKEQSPKTVLDLGTGGGLPGLPLAIMLPKTQFILVDSIEKKIKAVNQMAEKLGLQNVKTICDRIEKIDTKVDVMVARAVTKTKQIYEWGKKNIDPNSSCNIKGFWLLKGGDITAEMKEYGRKHKTYFLEDRISDNPYFKEKMLIHLTLK